MSFPSSNQRRPFDILIYGATGFTGKRVVKHIHDSHPEIKLAISGRSGNKLQSIITELELHNISTQQIFIASTDDESTLIQTFSQTKIVLACAGPFRQDFGKKIVHACLQAKTDYLDICGEPQFFDDILVEYDAVARSQEQLIVSACAFDCVPSELSAKLVARELRRYQLANQQPITVSGIEIVHTIDGLSCGNATTFHAAVDGFHASMKGELKKTRRRVQETYPIEKPPPPPKSWPKLPKTVGLIPTFHERSQTHLFKFMGADASAILSSDRYLRLRSSELSSSRDDTTLQNQPKPILSVCFGVKEKTSVCKVLGFGSIFSTLARWEFGCNLLHNHPEVFSGGAFREGGPTQEELNDTRFTTYSIAYGSHADEFVEAKCTGAEPGYVATPQMLTALALTVLNHRDSLPFKGGVMLPGALFGECEEAFTNLKNEGISFEIEGVSFKGNNDGGSANHAEANV